MFDFQAMRTALPEIIRYLPVTIQLTIGALIIALPVSFLFAIIILKNIPVIKPIVRFLISLVRGTPILLQMFVIYAIVPLLIQQVFLNMGREIDIYSVDSRWYAYIAISLSAIAFLTEAFRSAIESIDKGQKEAGYMVGLSGFQVFVRIIIPQALTIALPIMGNVVVDVIKTTSLAFTMSVTEVMGEAKILGGMNTHYLEMFMDVFFIYIIFVGTVEWLIKRLEKQLVRYKKA